MNEHPLKISRLGLRGWLLEPPGDPSERVQQRIWGLADQLAQLPDVAETVPGVGNLLVVRKDPPALSGSWIDYLRAAWRTCSARQVTARDVTIPVTYGGPLRDDLMAVAAHAGLDPLEVVRLHAAGTYPVYCIASSPGYGYLFGVDPRLFVPRKSTPLANVPTGSICIAGRQTGVTVVDGPNGWHVLGTTTVTMFDVAKEPPALLSAGDVVRFVIAGVDL